MPSIPFITGGVVSSELRGDGGGNFYGFWFRNDSGEDVVITDLGRWQRTGNSQTHSLRIYGPESTPNLLGSVSVNCSGATVGAFLYGTLASPVTIAAGGQCAIVSEEFTGGDAFGNNGGGYFTTTDIGVTWSAYVTSSTVKGTDSNRGYGPTNFKYSSPVAVWSKLGNVYTTDGNRYSVQGAINDASPGDQIDIPAGSFTWGAGGAYLNVNKAVTMRGAGTGSTTITISATGSSWTEGTIRISAAATVKDLTITQTGGGNSTAISTSTASGWRITNVIYNSASAVGYFVYFFGVFGLIDNCVITGGSGSDEWIFGRGPSDAWQTASNKGTVNAVYVEDCVLTGQGYLDANANASVVVRSCTIIPTTGSIKLDGHGTATNSPPRSFRLMECYRNTWTAGNSGGQPCFEIRGGTGFIFDNVSVDGPIYLGDYRVVYGTNDVGDYPLYDQVGTGQDPFPASAATEPLYLWHNRRSGGSNWAASPQIFATSMVGLVDPDRDYFDADTSFDGTSGTGRGTRAQMDAITPTLTGVGFWVTDEGNWDTTSPVDTSGRLYRWNGSAWSLYYTPYTYPHPLRGDVAAPEFTTQPQDQTVYSGDDVTLTVAVTGTPTPELQWRLDGGAISGETGTSLTLLDVTVGGAYDCVATNSEGSSTSDEAVLTVLPPSTTTPNPLAFRSNAMLALGAF